MSKILLAAGVVRDLEFDSPGSLEIYLYKLDHNKVLYQILDKFVRDDGSVVIRILQQYNAARLIQLYDNM